MHALVLDHTMVSTRIEPGLPLRTEPRVHADTFFSPNLFHAVLVIDQPRRKLSQIAGHKAFDESGHAAAEKLFERPNHSLELEADDGPLPV